MERILEIEDLKKYYGRQPNQTKALDGISFRVLKGEFLGIMGSSGSGKSTLLNCIASVTRPTGGRMLMRGQEIQRLRGAALAQYRGRKIGYLFQNFELLDREIKNSDQDMKGCTDKEKAREEEKEAM